jgi:GTP pyrophosphokinase
VNKQSGCLFLSERFTDAVEYARQLHTEFRKGTEIPYMAHLLGVAALVMGEAGGKVPVTENMVIAALLHDVVEDHGGERRLRDVERKFGNDVARMVAGLSDSFVENHEQKSEWKERKQTYIERLRNEADDVLLISAADKLYNAKAILEDFRQIQHAIWTRFKHGPEEQLWYFGKLLVVFQSRGTNRVVKELADVIERLSALIAATPYVGDGQPRGLEL